MSHLEPGLSLGVLSDLKSEYELIIDTCQKVGNIEGVHVYQEMLDEVDERIQEMERLN